MTDARCYRDLAAAILERAIEDVQCERTTPTLFCMDNRNKRSCPLCREQALRFLNGDWAEWLATMVGMDMDVWGDGLRRLSRIASKRNAASYAPKPKPKPRQPTRRGQVAELAAAAEAYLAEHPDAQWREVWRKVPNWYERPKGMRTALHRYGITLESPTMSEAAS